MPNSVFEQAGGIAGAAAADAWDIVSSTLFYHFNGTTWQKTTPPAIPNAASNSVFNPVAIAPDNVWALGQGTNGTFFVHWDGARWTYIPNAADLRYNHALYNIGGDAPNDVWAVLQQTSPIYAIKLERWDGSRWSYVAALNGASASYHNRILVFGPDDVWFTGDGTNIAVIAHWNGSRLTSTGLPHGPFYKPWPNFGYFTGTSASDLWYVAKLHDNATGIDRPYIARRTSSWGQYDTSLLPDGFNPEAIIDFRPGYAIFAGEHPPFFPALAVYNGYVRWRLTRSPLPAQSFMGPDVSVIKGTTSFWANVEFFAPREDGFAALVQCPSTPPAPL